MPPQLCCEPCVFAVVVSFVAVVLYEQQTGGLAVTHPHGDRQTAVDVGFLKPALLHDASPLGAQRR